MRPCEGLSLRYLLWSIISALETDATLPNMTHINQIE